MNNRIIPYREDLKASKSLLPSLASGECELPVASRHIKLQL